MMGRGRFLLASVSVGVAVAAVATIVLLIVIEKGGDQPSKRVSGVGGGGPPSPEVKALADSIPVPNGATLVQELISTGTDSMLLYNVDKPPSEVLAFYERGLGSNWTYEDEMGGNWIEVTPEDNSGYLKNDAFYPSSSTTFVLDSGQYRVMLSVAKNKGSELASVIGVTVQPK